MSRRTNASRPSRRIVELARGEQVLECGHRVVPLDIGDLARNERICIQCPRGSP